MNIEQLRTFCLSFPGATEDVKWGADLCFCVGAKMFCVTSVDSSDSGISFKCAPEKFEELIERDGIDPAAYVARYKWVNISKLDAVSPKELKDLITTSYQLVFDKLPPKIKKTIKGGKVKTVKSEKVFTRDLNSFTFSLFHTFTLQPL